MKTYNGKVDWFDVKKGIGFIKVAPSTKLELGIESHRDVFVHNTGVQFESCPLGPADSVEFQTDNSDPKGPRAVNVRVTKRATEVFREVIAP